MLSFGMIIGCRLCLCTDPRKSFTFLDFDDQEANLNKEALLGTSTVSKSLLVKRVAGLEVDFNKFDVFPNHVCEGCWQEVERLDQFQKMAKRNELFILQCQDEIKSVGLLRAKELFDSKSGESLNVVAVQESSEKELVKVAEDVEKLRGGDFQEKQGGEEDNELHERLQDCFFKVESEIIEKEVDSSDIEADDKAIEDDKKVIEVDNKVIKDESMVIADEVDCKTIEDDPSKCTICQKKFISAKGRLKHEKKIHTSTNAKCNICGKSVKYLTDHMKNKHPEIHQASTSGKCVICHEDYDSLRKHNKRYHTDVDSIACPICSKVFVKPKTGKLKAIVKQHIKLNHSLVATEKQQCPVCNNMYTNVNFHMKSTHSSEKAKCTFDNCKKVCKNKIRLQQHIRNIHTNRSPKVCPKCGDTYR